MIRRIINWLFLLPLGIIIVALCVANRNRVTLSLDPILREASPLTISVPLFLVVLGALACGVILGGFVVWWGQRIHRSSAKRSERELGVVRHEIERLRQQLAGHSGNAPRMDAGPPSLYDRSAV